ncbi:MAG TPA: dicarboxylate/amino acid:cation symporter [Gemmatimonadales bacterium]|jgi:Na+/H+-dicarboxylate symporter|nr:dicarboxylate/amino acid:cation symporter [Gemmatimonadales bacterium]
MSSSARVLTALVAGLALGAGAAASHDPSLRAIATGLEPVGTLWTNAIRMTVIPLVVALVITGVAATSDPRHVGRLGARALVIFVVLLVVGGGFALLVAPASLDRLAIAPDIAANLRAHAATDPAVEEAGRMPALVERIIAIVPANPARAAADGAILPLIVFTACFAVALARLEPARREPVVRIFQTVADVMLVVVGWVLAVAPIGIFALALGLAARMGAAAAGVLLHYVATLSGVLLLFTLALYPLVRALSGVPLGRFAAALAPAQAVAFSSRSSLAALPALVAGARDRLRAPPAITGFVLPLAVSLFRVNVPIAWVVGALFLGRLYGVPLDLPAMLGLVVTATLISFSVPGIPSGSLFLLAPVLVDLGLPAAGAGILIAVDAIPDIFKTTLNVTSHLATAAILGRDGRSFVPGPNPV